MPGKVATGLESLAVPISQHPGTLSSLLPVAPAGMKLLCWPPHPLQAGAVTLQGQLVASLTKGRWNFSSLWP